jgi:hypothetical protein
MKDLQKIKEFFSNPVNEAKDPDHLEKVRNIAKALPHRYNIKPNMGMVKVTSRSKDELVALKTELTKSNLYSEMRPTLAGMFELTVLDSPVNEAKDSPINTYKVGDILKFKDDEDWKVMKVKDNVGKLVIKPHNEKAKKGNVSLEIDIDLNYLKKNLLEAKKEDAVDTITMDIPLFLRMLEYSREDASQDMDLHDVTEKANLLGKERGILSMDDYEEIVGAAEEIDEAELTEAYVPSNIKEFAKRRGVSSLVNKVAGWAEKVGKSITGGTAIGYGYNTLVLDMEYQSGEIRINIPDETIELYDEPVNNFNQFERVYRYGPTFEEKELDEGMGGEIDEKYFVKVSNRDARKAIGTYEEYRDNSDIKKYDDTLYASNTPSDIYDFYYDLSSQDIEIDDWNIGEDDDYDYDSEYEKTLGENVAPNHDGKAAPYGSGYKPLEERIAKALEQINEELCPAGKAYIKRRQAAGEKSSAYLSGRAVKVCKGQMSGRAKKKK